MTRPRRAFKWKRKVNAPIKAAFGRALCISITGRRESVGMSYDRVTTGRKWTGTDPVRQIDKVLLLIKEKEKNRYVFVPQIADLRARFRVDIPKIKTCVIKIFYFIFAMK